MRTHADALSNQNQNANIEGFEIVGFVVDDATIADGSVIQVQALNGDTLRLRVVGDLNE